MKRLIFILLVALTIAPLSFCNARAAESEQDGLTAVLTADKARYNDGEAITSTLTVTNGNAFAVNDVFLESFIPDGYILSENASNTLSASTLGAGETVSLTVKWQPKKAEESDGNKSEDNVEATSAPVVEPQPSTDIGGSESYEATAAPDSSVTKGPQTGDSSSAAAYTVIFLTAAVGLCGCIFLSKKNKKRLMSIALCAAALGTAMTAAISASAAENSYDERSLSLSQSVSAGEISVNLTAAVRYTLPVPSEEQPAQPSEDDELTPATSNILIAYFSRVGNTSYAPDVDATTSASIVLNEENSCGTTEYMAREIQKAVGGDFHLIETAEPYPSDFDKVVDQNHSEINAGELPALKPSRLDIDSYDVVFIGYPVWATTVPRAVLSFLNEYALSGKTVIPFCTHDGYGAGSSYGAIAQACPNATHMNGLAVRAKDVTTSTESIKNWLDTIGIKRNFATTDIRITAGGHALDGVIYDTALAKEILQNMPISVSMVGYGGREYYGGLGFTPTSTGAGQLNFENGDITYCPSNNTLAIFYAQTDRPNLTMEVIPIGKVTSDLAVFNTLADRESITFARADSGGDLTPSPSKKVLVAYFSATGNTKGVSAHIVKLLGADSYEIIPEIPYSSADLNYSDSSSRTSVEMNDPNARPAISGTVENMDGYDVVFLGYPIWWGQAPRIVNTFLESYDFSGKTIIPFCTSGSSGLGSSADNLHNMASGADWLSGRRFSGSASEEAVAVWINELNLDLD